MSIVQKVVQTIAKHMPDAPIDPLIDANASVGKGVERRDAPLKVTGQAKFAAEVKLDGLAYAALVGSTIARGKITGIIVEAAKAAPGVLLVMTHENVMKMKAPAIMGDDGNGAAMSRLPFMQSTDVRWNGQTVAVVVAESQEQADYAATLVRVSYAEEEAKTVFADAPKKKPKDILGEPPRVEVGDAEAGLTNAAFLVDATYVTPRYNHNAIELHATIAEWHGDNLVLHDANQLLCASRHTLAKALGMKPDAIRVLSPFVGGAFGGKGVWEHHFAAIAAAKLCKRPVRVALSREDVFRLVGGRTCSEQRVVLAAKADGTLTALIHEGTTGVVDHNNFPEQFSFPARHLYAAENLRMDQSIVELDVVANCPMRAPGESIGTFALESAVDELAVKMDLDPIELRKRIEPEKDPVSGHAFSMRNLVEAYARGAKQFGWEKRKAPGAHREGEWRIGMGVATATYPYYRMPGGAARITLNVDGTATVACAAHEMGMGTATVQAQHAADRLGLPADRVTFVYGDTSLPDSVIAGGSTQTASIIAAVIAAYDALVTELLKHTGKDAPLTGAEAGDLISRNGGLYRKDDLTRGMTYAQLLQNAGKSSLSAEANAPPPLEMMKYSMHSWGAQFCEVRVSDVTGEVRVNRWLGSFDVGRVLNPRLAGSQFRGGIIMGIGMALTEETLLDPRSGRIANATLAEYHVPTHMDVPVIDVIFNDMPDIHAPLGVHGIGEIGITGCAAAIANAIYNATGKRVRSLPMTLDKVLAG